MLSETSVKEYMDILSTKYGVDLSREEANISAETLLRLYTAVFEHSEEEKSDILQKSHSTFTCKNEDV